MADIAMCNGCGFCCTKALCEAAQRLYRGATQCPQLLWNEGQARYVCGLMSIPGPLGQNYREELHAGAGCCSSLNSWRQDVKQRVPELKHTNLNPLPTIMQVFIKNLAGQFISSDVIHLALAGFQQDMVRRKYDPDEVNRIIKHIYTTFTSQRTSFTKEFIG